MEKEVEEAMEKSSELFSKIGELLEREKVENFEVIMACIAIITEACEDVLIVPKHVLAECLLKIINFHTKKK